MLKISSFLAVLVLVLCLSGCKQQQTRRSGEKKHNPNQNQGVIAAMGDSLTAGYGVAEQQSYPALLEKKLQADGHDFRVINGGVSGETSSGALSRLAWILNLKPDIVILETGANDGLRGIDPALTRKNIAEIVRNLQEKNITVVLAGMRMVANLGPRYTRAFNSIYPEIAGETKVIFMPFFLEGVAADPALNTEDGIHPNPEGYKIIVDNLFPYVLQAIAQREK